MVFGEVYKLGSTLFGRPILSVALTNFAFMLVMILSDTKNLISVKSYLFQMKIYRLEISFLTTFVFLIFLLPLLSSCFGSPMRSFDFPSNPWLVVVMVPIVEEVVFRKGVGSFIRKRWPGWGGIYLSALFFGALHTSPSFGRLVAGDVGVALGPFLLGIVCEILLMRTRLLMFPILFHSFCNGSIFIFSAIDGRWLDWLSILYV